MPKVGHLSHLVVSVRDLEKMVAFYQEHLGLQVTHGNNNMVFMSSDPEFEDHMLAFAKGLEGESNKLAHMAWRVDTVEEVKAFYDHCIAEEIPIHHTISHAYAFGGNTVSCYFFDPEGNRVEVFSMVEANTEGDRSGNYLLDFHKEVNEIADQAMRKIPAADKALAH